jgi:hypothetical protein
VVPGLLKFINNYRFMKMLEGFESDQGMIQKTFLNTFFKMLLR